MFNLKSETGLMAIGFCYLLFGICTPAAYAQSSSTVATTGKFDMVTTVHGDRIDLKTDDTYTYKDKLIRIDSFDMDEMVSYVEILSGLDDYNYVPSQQTALKTVLPQEGPSLMENMLAETNAMLQGASKQGTSKVEGYDCTEYTRPGEHNIGNVDFWLSNDPKFPLIIKKILTTPSGITQTVVLENIVLGGVVDPSQFTLPTGTKIVTPPAQGSTAPSVPSTGSGK